MPHDITQAAVWAARLGLVMEVGQHHDSDRIADHPQASPDFVFRDEDVSHEGHAHPCACAASHLFWTAAPIPIISSP